MEGKSLRLGGGFFLWVVGRLSKKVGCQVDFFVDKGLIVSHSGTAMTDRRSKDTMKYRRELRNAYIYHDGTLVEIFDEFRDGAVLGETADVTRGYCKRVHCVDASGTAQNYGRLIVSSHEKRFLKLAKGRDVRIVTPRLELGSQNTQAARIAVGHVELNFGCWDDTLSWTILGSLLTFPLHPQVEPGHTADFDDLYPGQILWPGWDARVAKVKDLREKKVTPVAT